MRTSFQNLLKAIPGVSFSVQDTFLVADTTLPEHMAVAKNGHEIVSGVFQTKPHKHTFVSIYYAENLDLIHDTTTIKLPKQALVIVPQGTSHSWKPKDKKGGTVASLDARHRKQKLVF